ncbi:MAG: hypothetical protein K6A30_01910 [Lachnospiraceae bacterium]|nr:hypothetical protein [Lachnospiraceae bacterium]
MKEIFEQYGGAIITVVAVVALAAIVTTLLQTGEGGVVYGAMSKLITDFAAAAGVAVKGA